MSGSAEKRNDAVIVGADRVTAEGDVCNKIGTYLKALAAHDNKVPFYVALPSPTIDFTVSDGVAEIQIEQRSPDEVVTVTGKTKDGCLRHHTVRGVLMHSSLVVTPTGLPLGLTAIKFWTRKQFKGCNALKRKINPTRVPIEEKESYRWLENVRQSTALIDRPADCVHIGDRESDIYELFHAAGELGTRFLVRTCVNRLAGDGEHTVADEMRESRPKGIHRVQARTKDGEVYEAVLQIKYERLLVRPSRGLLNPPARRPSSLRPRKGPRAA